MKNFKNWIIIDKEGLVKTKVMLNHKDDRLREVIILKHFIKFYELAYGIKLPYNIIERDNPHDFTLGFYDKEKTFIEIVSISDKYWGHKIQNMKEKLEKLLNEKKINYPIIAFLPHNTNTRELKKIIKNLELDHSILDIERSVTIFREAKKKKGAIIKRLSGSELSIIVVDGEKLSLKDVINESIENKEIKGYKNIDKMILIVDDKFISYSRKEIEEILTLLAIENKDSLFKEIFIYSGYYSEDNGYSSLFSIFPIKKL
ncbi:MAG: hypothetical protein UR60_C0010G0012 [Candidatus Moranbacteria bacterium GW2011_GWF2_34_56]|nr:MAG: hypothetical protein UR51_C0001G0036 [Candidatus Moranbacteria bacterium GW2011_GWF1_34_10]KKP65023.1 MAG: hypothetical protein UR60_C0010G0012 [Candidatus Moranbacteria bacterium GW2011_GWF2_34_56]HBI16934.1 hypothetical protein [Candidatus Moranbacteria bacterium]